MEYKDKIVWITGASSGIGEALSVAFASKGARVILSGRNEKELERVKARCREAGREGFICPLDLTSAESIHKAVNVLAEQFGRIDYLVNNGGISQRSLLIDTPVDIDRRIMEVNYFGAITLTKAILPLMVKGGGGHITVISSVVGKYGFPMRSAYSASKHALHGFFDTLRTELKPSNIRVTIVCPGLIRTNVSINALESDGRPHGVMDPRQDKGMDVDVCASRIIRAVGRRKREVYIGKIDIILIYIRKWWPWLFFRIAGNVKPT